MKIAIFNWRDIKNPKAGGAELYFHELAKRWVSQGNEVTWISGGWENCKKNENIDGINIIRTGSELTLYLLAPIEYLKLKSKPDIIIDVENGIPFFTPLYSRRKVILHIHHIHKDIWFREGTFPLAQIGWFLETKIMPALYKNKNVITISNSSREEIKKEGLRKILGVVNPGIDFPRFDKIKKESKPTILFLNRVKKYKGIDTLLNTALLLKDKEINFLIAGSGDYLEQSKKFVLENHLQNVKFLGRVSEDKKRQLMQKSWVFANPSFKEGWGIVNIESNYFGTPVIGSNVSGIKDSVINGKTGLLFEYGNPSDLASKILTLINNKNLRNRLQIEAKKWAKKFDWDIKAKEYLNLIKKHTNT
jgi:glycosyltransferase involved in cell wall biosynthesis